MIRSVTSIKIMCMLSKESIAINYSVHGLAPYIIGKEIATIKCSCNICLCRQKEKIYKVVQFMEVTVPNMFPDVFQRFFRLTPKTVNKLIHFLLPLPRLQKAARSYCIPAWKKIYMLLAYLGTQSSIYRLCGLLNEDIGLINE